MSECVSHVRSILLFLSAIMIFLGSIFIVFALYTSNTTHLELVVERVYPDGRRETHVQKPSPFSASIVMQDRKVYNWNDTLHLYIVWVIEPEDWNPLVDLHVEAYKSLYSGSEPIIINVEHWRPYDDIVPARDGSRTECFHPISISNETLMTAFGEVGGNLSKGTYTLEIKYVATYKAKDPLGAEHVGEAELTYKITYQIVSPSEIFMINASLNWKQGGPMQQYPTYSFRTSQSSLIIYGAVMIVIGVASLLLTPVIPYRVCRVG